MTTRKRTGTCTEATFWEAVADLDWKGRCGERRVYNAIKSEILSQWDDEFTRSFDELLGEKVSHLYGVVDRYEKVNDVSCGCGDDGFSDLLHHIVGMGKEEYDAVLQDPMRAVKRGQAYDYVESFSYCMPHLASEENAKLTMEEARAKVLKDEERRAWGDEEGEEINDDEIEMRAIRLVKGDRAEVDPAYYAAWARRELPDIEALLESPFTEQVGEDDIRKVHRALSQVAAGNLSQEWKDVKNAVARLMKRRSKVLRDAREKLEAELEVLNYGRHASMENLFVDGADYFGGEAR